MFRFLQGHKGTVGVSFILRTLVCLLTISLTLGPSAVYAQSVNFFNLPVPGSMVSLSPGFTPALLQGIIIDQDNPLKLDFIVDTGDTGIKGEELKVESLKMVKYFYAALTVPEEEMWVNLSPNEPNRIVPEGFGVTEMGRDLLAQDYILKQLTASLLYPEDELGQKFWDRVYAKARKLYGNTEIPVNTFNKVWIVPKSAFIFEKDNKAMVLESKLEVMLDSDYMAMSQSHKVTKSPNQKVTGDLVTGDIEVNQIIREVILPEIENEVNEGETFANLRQIYSAMILAAWYKQNLKNSLLGQVYVDQNKTKGVDVEDRNVKQKIYEQYMEAFKTGVYDYIREDYDPVTQELVPRKYFSGGFSATRGQSMTGAGSSPIMSVTQVVKNDITLVPRFFREQINKENRFLASSLAIEMPEVVTDEIIEEAQVMAQEIISSPVGQRWVNTRRKPSTRDPLVEEELRQEEQTAQALGQADQILNEYTLPRDSKDASSPVGPEGSMDTAELNKKYQDELVNLIRSVIPETVQKEINFLINGGIAVNSQRYWEALSSLEKAEKTQLKALGKLIADMNLHIAEQNTPPFLITEIYILDALRPNALQFIVRVVPQIYLSNKQDFFSFYNNYNHKIQDIRLGLTSVFESNAVEIRSLDNDSNILSESDMLMRKTMGAFIEASVTFSMPEGVPGPVSSPVTGQVTTLRDRLLRLQKILNSNNINDFKIINEQAFEQIDDDLSAQQFFAIMDLIESSVRFALSGKPSVRFLAAGQYADLAINNLRATNEQEFNQWFSDQQEVIKKVFNGITLEKEVDSDKANVWMQIPVFSRPVERQEPELYGSSPVHLVNIHNYIANVISRKKFEPYQDRIDSSQLDGKIVILPVNDSLDERVEKILMDLIPFAGKIVFQIVRSEPYKINIEYINQYRGIATINENLSNWITVPGDHSEPIQVRILPSRDKFAGAVQLEFRPASAETLVDNVQVVSSPVLALKSQAESFIREHPDMDALSAFFIRNAAEVMNQGPAVKSYEQIAQSVESLYERMIRRWLNERRTRDQGYAGVFYRGLELIEAEDLITPEKFNSYRQDMINGGLTEPEQDALLIIQQVIENRRAYLAIQGTDEFRELQLAQPFAYFQSFARAVDAHRAFMEDYQPTSSPIQSGSPLTLEAQLESLRTNMGDLTPSIKVDIKKSENLSKRILLSDAQLDVLTGLIMQAKEFALQENPRVTFFTSGDYIDLTINNLRAVNIQKFDAWFDAQSNEIDRVFGMKTKLNRDPGDEKTDIWLQIPLPTAPTSKIGEGNGGNGQRERESFESAKDRMYSYLLNHSDNYRMLNDIVSTTFKQVERVLAGKKPFEAVSEETKVLVRNAVTEERWDDLIAVFDSQEELITNAQIQERLNNVAVSSPVLSLEEYRTILEVHGNLFWDQRKIGSLKYFITNVLEAETQELRAMRLNAVDKEFREALIKTIKKQNGKQEMYALGEGVKISIQNNSIYDSDDNVIGNWGNDFDVPQLVRTAWIVHQRNTTQRVAQTYSPQSSSPVKTSDQLSAAQQHSASVVSGQFSSNDVGGIDFNPQYLDLQIKRDGNGVPLPLNVQPIETMHIEGFLPVIINITPVMNMPMLLGVVMPEEDNRDYGQRDQNLYGRDLELGKNIVLKEEESTAI